MLIIPAEEVGEVFHQATRWDLVEIVGYVRILPRQQATYPNCGLESHCDDPDLPALPNARADWPSVSVTVFDVTDATPFARRTGGLDAQSPGDIVQNASSQRGRAVRLVGLFRGRNLYGDLPASTRRGATDWVLKDGEAVWVTGKAPRGKGWALDPGDQNDTLRWLLVEGKVEVQGEVVYIRASKVELTSNPRRAAEAPER